MFEERHIDLVEWVDAEGVLLIPAHNACLGEIEDPVEHLFARLDIRVTLPDQRIDPLFSLHVQKQRKEVPMLGVGYETSTSHEFVRAVHMCEHGLKSADLFAVPFSSGFQI